ncbi:flagellar biosynthesis protein FlhB [Tenuibacillus multivorans]|uniref:Flagellar biosynthetic protein FlhB n=1 Tax=Tenuibacillus multivorans TaxID=237069 RepID=A0A1G9XYI2_9BACI|nr:flagellar biosynthesis protein FlhB [Tenuibacillus multivorans]GEL75862.1 flagellar biosynthetic protein FlhB [Tenuibacillus multivorans]SDN01571.1 flagellar biosynthetic protein FlhB [Tenuibacillus multivorans]
MKPLRLDLQFFNQEKTEKATPKKRQDSRKKGQVAKSQDVNTSVMLFIVFMFLIVFGSFMGEILTGMYTYSFTEFIHWELTASNIESIMFQMTVEAVKLVLPIMAVAIVAAFLANYIQIGFLFSTEAIKFDLKKVDPIKGFKRIFSARALVEFLKSMLKILAIGAVCFTIIWINKDDMMLLSMKSVNESIAFFGQLTVWMGIASSLVLMFLAIPDYLYQRYDYEKNIRMSKQDVKDEHKNIEGDPLIKSRIKEQQRQMAQQRMMSEVPEADVVITNPTHFAVAIKYEEAKSDTPFVVAKGVDYIAFKIKEIAKAHDVITLENRSLARGLYQAVELGDEIPEEFFQAVAEVLAYVYSVQRKA